MKLIYESNFRKLNRYICRRNIEQEYFDRGKKNPAHICKRVNIHF